MSKCKNVDKALAMAKEILADIDEMIEDLRKAVICDDVELIKEISNDLISYCDSIK
ncbi:hypothetical protein CIG2463D_1006 [Campylobacter iguaniorum]|uniref:hypothetical protein n=1 Tax=Campylobacter iguaniorum TaxID=1244531 RepID=UPI00073AB517|nr:hypothetical protein [Campylobacter iguaniorum]ALV24579.1 hypothetical protein CIG2463D_1006 [Campylobacter iguaniorum]